MAKATEPVVESRPVAHAEFIGEKPYGREFTGARKISRKDLEKSGILVDRDLEWNADNNWTVEFDPENTALAEYFVKTDPGFRVLDLPDASA